MATQGTPISKLPRITSPEGIDIPGVKSGRTGKISTDLLATKAEVTNIDNYRKGYFSTDTELKAAYPSPKVGYYAYVGSTGTIWKQSGGTWIDSSDPIPDDVDLSLYAKNEDLVQLGREVEEYEGETNEKLNQYEYLLTLFQLTDNPEFLAVISDVNGKILQGFTPNGKAFLPSQEYMQKEALTEWLFVILSKSGKILFGINIYGATYIAKGMSQDTKKEIKSIKDQIVKFVEKEDGKELIDTRVATIFDFIDSEYVELKLDAAGKMLSWVDAAGNTFFSNQSLFGKISDKENRLFVELSKSGKILSYRKLDGTKVETKLKILNSLDLSDGIISDLAKKLLSTGFFVNDNLFDWSDKKKIHIPRPRSCAIVNLISDSLPVTKTDDIACHIEYYDMDGNYFRKPGIINAQGSSSMIFIKKNFGVDILNEDGSAFELKFGNWVTQDSFHWKAFYTDTTLARCPISYKMGEMVISDREFKYKKPWNYLIDQKFSDVNSSGNSSDDYANDEPLAHPDAFPFVIYHNGNYHGLFSWQLKKHRDNYKMKKSNAKHIQLDGALGDSTIWLGDISWKDFEVSNPKDLITVDGNKYDGDHPKEITGDSSVSAISAEVKGYIQRLSGFSSEIAGKSTAEEQKVVFEAYFNVPYFIDYFVISQLNLNTDGFVKNWIWVTYDGLIWSPTLYDHDMTFGAQTTVCLSSVGSNLYAISKPATWLRDLYTAEIKERYKSLRNRNIITLNSVMQLFYKWAADVGTDNYLDNINKWKESPSYRKTGVDTVNWIVQSENLHINNVDKNTYSPYDNETLYTAGEKVYQQKGDYAVCFEAKRETQGNPPVVNPYNEYPYFLGYFESIERIKRWLKIRLERLDNILI
jgi:hypothetical protein